MTPEESAEKILDLVEGKVPHIAMMVQVVAAHLRAYGEEEFKRGQETIFVLDVDCELGKDCTGKGCSGSSHWLTYTDGFRRGVEYSVSIVKGEIEVYEDKVKIATPNQARKLKKKWLKLKDIVNRLRRGLEGDKVIGWFPVGGRDYPIKPKNAPKECSCVGEFHSNNCYYKPTQDGGKAG